MLKLKNAQVEKLGRLTILRWWRRKAWGFESPPGHQFAIIKHMELKDKIVVITGGTKGLGKALALSFLKKTLGGGLNTVKRGTIRNFVEVHVQNLIF